MRAATLGDCRPGRTATRKRNRSVCGAKAEATTQESSQLLPGRQQHAVIAQRIGRLGDLAQIGEIDGAAADAGAEVTAVAVGRNEPEDVRRLDRAHDAGSPLNCETPPTGSIEAAWRDRAAGCGATCDSSSSRYLIILSLWISAYLSPDRPVNCRAPFDKAPRSDRRPSPRIHAGFANAPAAPRSAPDAPRSWAPVGPCSAISIATARSIDRIRCVTRLATRPARMRLSWRSAGSGLTLVGVASAGSRRSASRRSVQQLA